MLRKHINNTDVAIEILKCFYVRETKTYKLKVSWWNIGKCHAPFPMGIVEKIEIPLDKMVEWEHYEYVGRGDVE